MKKKHIYLYIALFLFCRIVSAAPRGAQELVLSGSWIYDALTQISLEAGTVNFTDSAPLTIQEITVYLNEIDYNSLSKSGKKQYDRIKSYFKEQNISFDSGIFSLGTTLTANLEGYYKSNDGLDWIYDRYSKKALIEAPVVFSAQDYFTMMCDVILSENKGGMSQSNNYTNVPLSLSQMDVNFPHEAYFSTGYKFTDTSGLSFQLALGSQSVGRTSTGSIIWSDYLTGTTYGQLSFYSPNLKYTGTVTQLGVDKYMYMHRFEARLFDKLTFGAMEGMLISQPLELRFFNPITIFHGFAPWRDYDSSANDSDSNSCAYMCFKLNYTPVKYVRIYALFAQDQYQTWYERTNWPDDLTPNGLGGQLGVESYIPISDGFFHFSLEGYYADPYLYIKQSPNWSLVRTYSEDIGDSAIFYEWIGSPFGPDTLAAELTAGYNQPGSWSLDTTYLFMCRGENSRTSVFDDLGWGGQYTDTDLLDLANNWAYPTTENGNNPWATTPTGIPEYVNRISVRGTWKPKSWLSFTAQPGYVFIFNHNHDEGSFAQGIEFALSVTCSRVSLFGL